MAKLRIGRYAFDTGVPLPELGTPWADAFAVDAHADHPGGLYAAIQNHPLPPRTDVLDTLENKKIGLLQTVLEYEVVNMGASQKLGFVLERPPGPALVEDINKPFASFREDDLRSRFIRPLLDTLAPLHERVLFHGAISPMNLFAKSGLAQLMLGQCVAVPPGYAQPALFEPIERAQCPPCGKGDSTVEDDFFAMGVTAYLLSVGHNPFSNLSDEELIRARLEVGTATLMLSHAKLPPGILELVRGVCGDHPKQRWNFGEMEGWLSGNRVQQRAVAQAPKAARALIFNGKEYFRPRNLAVALSSNPAETRKIVDNKEILRWLQRSLGDLGLYDEVKIFLEKLPTNENNDVLAAKLAMSLDSQGPIRYKGVIVMPSAIGTELARAFIDKDTGTQQKIAEIITANLGNFWVGLEGNGSTYNLNIAKELDQARGYLNVNGLGFGMERVLYELQRTAPCYSDMFDRYYVLGLRQLLPALDAMASDARRSPEVLDRHSAAFLAARIGRGQENLLKALNPSKDPATRAIAVLNLLANVQSRHGVQPMPKLASWLSETLKPALDKFHSAALRSSLQKNMAKMAATGDLASLQRAIDSTDVVEGDLQGFRLATRQFHALQHQMRDVNLLIENKTAVGLAVGQRLAAAASVMLGLLAVAFAVAKAVR